MAINYDQSRIFYVTLSEGGEITRQFIPAIDPQGRPCMFDKVHKKTYYNKGTGAFIVGMTLAQARQLSKLPVVEAGDLTVSLPWEAQWDTGVQNALTIAKDRGWTIAVQYRDPEIATTNMPISFLESTGEQYINTNVVPDSTIEFDMQIAYPIPLKETVGYNVFFGCTGRNSYGNFRCAHSSYSDGNPNDAFVMEGYYWWRYDPADIKARKIYRLQTTLKPLDTTTPDVFIDGTPIVYLQKGSTYSYTGPITTPIGLFGRIGFGEIASKYTPFIIKSVHLIKNGTSAFNAIGVLDSTGIPCMYDRITKQLIYNSGTGAFIAGFDMVEQARKLATLPDVTAVTDETKKSLTVSLPWEAQWDAGVQSALFIAADRGWIITVQYRDPEITTTNIPISFLESTGEQYIKIPYITTADTVAEGSMQFIEFYNTNLVKYAMGTTNYPLGMGWGVFDNNGSAWGWYFSGKKSVGFKFDSAPDKASVIHYKINTQGELWINGDKAKDISPQTKTDAVVTSIGLFGYVQTNGNVKAGEKERHFYCDIFEGSKKTVSLSPVISSNGVPCMHDRITKQSLSNSGTGAFTAGFNAVESARKLATLPDVTAVTDETKKSLTVSLPWEAQLVITGVSAAVQVAVDRGWQITAQYRDAEADNAYYNRYAACTIKDDMLAVNSDYMNDLTYDGSWVYPLPELGNSWQIFTSASKVKRLYFSAPKVTDSGEICETNNVEYVELNVPQCTRLRWAVWRCSKVTEIQVNAPLMTQAQMFAEGCTRLRVFRGSLSKLTDGSNMFHGCQLDKESVLLILNSLPAYTSGSHPITIGIHIDYETDPDVLSAIALADIAQTPVAEGGKGWTVTVQWNGTATTQTTSTYGLRRRPVYAKLSTIELFDGTTETLLDWGHYVTSWEERGYQEFASLEEAEEYFNINQTEEV